jgi:hypothetical protein
MHPERLHIEAGEWTVQEPLIYGEWTIEDGCRRGHIGKDWALGNVDAYTIKSKLLRRLIGASFGKRRPSVWKGGQ